MAKPFVWHGDSYDLPDGAVQITRSVAFENQGALSGTMSVLQFHLEVRPEWVQTVVKRDAGELVLARSVQSAEEILNKPDGLHRENNALMTQLLRSWLRHALG